MNYLIKYLLFSLSIIFFIGSATAQTKFVNVTGRAVIIDNTPALSRKVALEDALYLAALEGGAIISGYSALDAQTNLSEEIIVRPASGILDYTITNETGNLYIGDAGVMHQVNVLSPFEGKRITIAFDIEDEYNFKKSAKNDIDVNTGFMPVPNSSFKL